MTLRLTPQMLAAAYDFLRATQPFSGWKLPESDAVAFTVNHHKYWFGSHQGASTCTISISDATVGLTETLIRVMAHEMIHLRQYLHGEETAKVAHNLDFRKKAALVCKYHGFDVKAF